jgi:hypothetical protein
MADLVWVVGAFYVRIVTVNNYYYLKCHTWYVHALCSDVSVEVVHCVFLIIALHASLQRANNCMTDYSFVFSCVEKLRRRVQSFAGSTMILSAIHSPYHAEANYKEVDTSSRGLRFTKCCVWNSLRWEAEVIMHPI